MKNIHILPTDKPSRLYKQTGVLLLDTILDTSTDGISINQHIYITSNEEIKEGDWCIDKHNVVYKQETDKIFTKFNGTKKIILTTDQDLIKDGVQAIDDEFLEWFVKNPSCERVKIERGKLQIDDDGQEYGFPDMSKYKIIISKEEPKPHSFCETPESKCTMNYCDENGCQNRKRELVEPQEEPKQDYSGVHLRHCYQGEYEDGCKYGEDDCPAKPLEKPKKLTDLEIAIKLEEIEREEFQQETVEKGLMEIELNHTKILVYSCERALEERNEQIKRMYSEEDVYHILCEHTAFLFAGGKSTLSEWFEKYKKK